MKRFYQNVTVQGLQQDSWQVMLDTHVLRTRKGHVIAFASEGLAAKVASEWEAQAERIEPDSMVITGIYSLALDVVASERERLIEELLGYADTDLLYYFAEEPDVLVARQRAAWEPLLSWLAAEYGVRAVTTQGVMPVAQPAEMAQFYRKWLAGLDDVRLAAVFLVTKGAGSLLLALALAEGRLQAAQLFEAALLDEVYQQEEWGEDVVLQERAERLKAEIEAVEAVFKAL